MKNKFYLKAKKIESILLKYGISVEEFLSLSCTILSLPIVIVVVGFYLDRSFVFSELVSNGGFSKIFISTAWVGMIQLLIWFFFSIFFANSLYSLKGAYQAFKEICGGVTFILAIVLHDFLVSSHQL